MTPQPQQEYIITLEYIEKLDTWLGEHGIDDLQRMQIYSRLTLDPSRPHTSTPKTWESCHEHFMCPTGEECWYLSEDYHKDQITATRYATLDKLYDKANQRQMDVETEDGTIIEVIEKGEVLGWIGSLRSEP